MAQIKPPYAISKEQIWQEAGGSPQGLPHSEAQKRLKRDGPNQLQSAAANSWLKRLSRQLLDPMVVVLCAAAVISAAINEWADSLIIAVVVLVNACLGLYQEGKAEKAVEALAAMTAPTARVLRDGRWQTIPAAEVVVGDMVMVEAGDAAPADLRLTDCHNLRADESALTGESQAVEKQSHILNDGTPLAEQSNMLFMGCGITYGRGEGCVVATGMDTEMGKIAALLDRTENQASPLQKKLAQLSRLLSLGVSGICAFIFVFSVLAAGDFSAAAILDAFMLAVSLAVAAIPEGLVVVVTLVLSLGMAAMSKRKAIVRRLPAVETLGAASVICCDKTGTLTQNKMTVQQTQGVEAALAGVFAHCNDAALDTEGEWQGDPTETALAAYAQQHIGRLQPRLDELPFDSERKLMSTLHRQKDGSYIQYTKGAPEILLGRCTSYLDAQGRLRPLHELDKEKWRNGERSMAGQALRVLAAAQKVYPAASQAPAIVEQGLTFVGLAGLIDPPRPEALPAVQAARRAGVATVMISGDSLATAEAVGKALHILPADSHGMDGEALAAISDDQLVKNIEKYRLFARVKPEDKLRVVRAWQKKGYVTAMTGDGVNDAPALKAADIGCGMGKNGSQVSKKASDLVLADDNFATIISAIQEGRRIYENIRKAIQFLLSANLAEVLVIFIATLLSIKLFLPIHLLWINLITDCFPAVALGLEKAEEDIMRQPPRRPDQGIFSGGMAWDILWQGLLLAALPLCSFFSGGGGMSGMTMAFLTLISAEIFHSLNMRSRDKSLFQLKSANFPLFWAMGGAFAANMLLLSWPATRELFKLATLSCSQTLWALGLGLAVIPAVECGKAIKRRRYKNS